MGNFFEQGTSVTNNESQLDRIKQGSSGGDHLQHMMNEVEQARQSGGSSSGGFRAGDSAQSTPSSASGHLPALELFDNSKKTGEGSTGSSPTTAGGGDGHSAPAGSSERAGSAQAITSPAGGEAQFGLPLVPGRSSSPTNPGPVR